MMKSLLLLTLSMTISIPVLAESVSQRSREYRPLEAKKISIRTAARVNPDRESAKTFVDFKRIGWSHFDNREWKEATDAFLSALEKDPESVEVAEALAMSLYRSGDYESAYRLGQELHRVMPSVGRIVSQTVQADVRFMVKKGELESAEEFLAHFPAADPAYTPAHELISDATTIAAALRGNGDESIDPAQATKESLVKN